MKCAGTEQAPPNVLRIVGQKNNPAEGEHASGIDTGHKASGIRAFDALVVRAE
jgi:hypothetical protein